MRIYSDFAGRRTFEIVGDLLAIAVIVGGVMIALTLHAAIASVGAVGQQLQDAGHSIADPMTGIADSIVGDGLGQFDDFLAAPFQGIASGGQGLISAGTSFQQGMETVASLVGWSIVVLVVLLVVLSWLRPRVAATIARTRVARLASAAPTLDLLAFRALVNQPARDVARIEGAVDGWRRGDTATLQRLAALELKAAGVRLRPR